MIRKNIFLNYPYKSQAALFLQDSFVDNTSCSTHFLPGYIWIAAWALNRFQQDFMEPSCRIFCCEWKCVEKPSDPVDGMACKRCRGYGWCRCACRLFKRRVRKVYCCGDMCIRPVTDICVLCPDKCLCLCVIQQAANDDMDALLMFGRKVEMVCKRDLTFCCPLECFRRPRNLIRGLACWNCKAVNYCKCKCKTWMNTHQRALKAYGESGTSVPAEFYLFGRIENDLVLRYPWR